MQHRWDLFYKRLWHPFAFSPLQTAMFLLTRILGDFGDMVILFAVSFFSLLVLDHVSRSGCLVSACTFSMTDKIRDWVFFDQSTLNQPFWLIKSQMHLKIYITKILGEKCSRICSPHYFFKQGVFCNIRTRLWVFDCWLLL